MNLEYMKVSLFEISYKKKELFHYILFFLDAPVCVYIYIYIYNLTFYTLKNPEIKCITDSTKKLSSTTDNNKKILRDHVTMKTGLMAAKTSALPSQEKKK